MLKHIWMCILLSASGLAVTSVFGQEPQICTYPRRQQVEPFDTLRPDSVIRSGETEPNDKPVESQRLKLGFGVGEDSDVDISGKVAAAFDKDFYDVSLNQGEILGVACLNLNTQSGFDPRIEVLGSDGTSRMFNDNHNDIGSLYPQKLTLPVGGDRTDSVLAMCVPATGKYHVRVSGIGASRGEYFLQLRLRKPGMLTELSNAKQILFLDFDGAHIQNGPKIFGFGAVDEMRLSPLKTFLTRWGLSDADESDVISATVNCLESILTKLSTHPLNGNAGDPGSFGFELRNSRDHGDEFGSNPLVSRVVIGGTIPEFGIETIGLAQYIDPGNFSTNDTAVVLLDLLSESASDPNSVLSLKIERGEPTDREVVRFSDLPRKEKIALIGKILGTIALHEAGHFLGCFHCENSNDVCCVMDQGGNLKNFAGAGRDGILGTGDDAEAEIVEDHFANEMFSTSHKQSVDAMFLFALSTGTRSQSLLLAELEAQRLRLMLAQNTQRSSSDDGGVRRLTTISRPTNLSGNAPPSSFPDNEITISDLANRLFPHVSMPVSPKSSAETPTRAAVRPSRAPDPDLLDQLREDLNSKIESYQTE